MLLAYMLDFFFLLEIIYCITNVAMLLLGYNVTIEENTPVGLTIFRGIQAIDRYIKILKRPTVSKCSV
jgi:hypothetical protein